MTKFCILESFAAVAQINKLELIQKIGHDGTAIIDQSAPSPYMFKSFTIDEMTFALYQLGLKCVSLSGEYLKEVIKRYPFSRFVAFKDTHCIGYRDGKVIDTQDKLKTLDDIINWNPDFISIVTY